MWKFTKVSMLSVSVLLASLSVTVLAAQDTASEYTIQDQVYLHKDKTYTDETTFDRTVQRASDIDDSGRFSTTFDPHNQTFTLLEAWVMQPDGHRINIPASRVLVRPSAAAQNAPGFVSTKTATILFPQVRVGSKVHAKVKLTTFKAYKLGYNDSFTAGIFHNGDVSVTINAPASLPLSIGERNGFHYTNKVKGERRIISGEYHMRGVSPSMYENHMPNSTDLIPLLSVSTMTSYLDIAKQYHDLSKGKAAVTPEIQTLADHITQGKEGKAAAKALYNWVTKNIRYVAMYLTANSSWIPHSADQVLKNGFGDCKDHVVLLQALLAAKGIQADPAIVNWSDQTQDWPAPSVSAFNHMIIYLPQFDLYANPTDQNAPFGVLDYGLSNKLVLLVGKHGKVARTPTLTTQTAQFTTKGAIRIERDGTLQGTAHVTMSPSLSSYLRYSLSNKENRENALKSALSNLPHYGFGHIQTSDSRDLDTPFTFSMDWLSRKALRVGSRAFVLPNVPNFAPQDAPQNYLGGEEARHFPVMLQPKTVHWHFTITPPKGFVFDALPPNTQVKNAAGSYTGKYHWNANEMVVDRELVLKVRKVPADKNAQVEHIARAMIDDLNAIVSLHKTDTQ